ncbi:MAG: hypothetical protein R6V03_11215, partial [Kiritimatiellia bacterium]
MLPASPSTRVTQAGVRSLEPGVPQPTPSPLRDEFRSKIGRKLHLCYCVVAGLAYTYTAQPAEP